MSITVNYKGEQIAQSSGDNLTLLTAGQTLEADVILQASGGGSGVETWLPASAELLAEETEHLNLSADTDWDTTDFGTTQKTIVPTAQKFRRTLTDADWENYEYAVLCEVSLPKVVYSETPTTGTALAGQFHTVVFRYLRRGLKSFVSRSSTGTKYALGAQSSFGQIIYYASGNYSDSGISLYSSTAYGVYLGSSLSCASAANDIYVNRPSIAVKSRDAAPTTAANLALIDSTRTSIDITTKFYRYPMTDGFLYTRGQNTLYNV